MLVNVSKKLEKSQKATKKTVALCETILEIIETDYLESFGGVEYTTPPVVGSFETFKKIDSDRAFLRLENKKLFYCFKIDKELLKFSIHNVNIISVNVSTFIIALKLLLSFLLSQTNLENLNKQIIKLQKVLNLL